MSCAKMAEPIEVPFGMWTRVGPTKHVLDGGPDPPYEGTILRGKGQSIVKHWDSLLCGGGKMAEPIEVPFGMWTRVGPTKHVLVGGSRSPIRRDNFEGEKGSPL